MLGAVAQLAALYTHSVSYSFLSVFLPSALFRLERHQSGEGLSLTFSVQRCRDSDSRGGGE
jgi:hypothetical protein